MKKLNDLTDKLSQKVSVTQYKKNSYKVPSYIKDVITLIRTNKFNWSNHDHVKKLNKAIELNFIDEDLNILKEV